jgi:hypothetical protein
LRNRKGLSSVIGSIFFIIVFTSAATYVVYSMNQIDKIGQTIITKSQDDRNRDHEAFEITGVTRDNNKFNITVQNTGQLPLNITRLWVQNKTDPTWSTTKFSINQAVSPGQTLTKVGQNLNLAALPTQAYDISLVTDRGNTKEFLVNSASQKPIILQLFVLPEKVSTGFSTTLLFAVTNNMSNNGALTNLTPYLSVVQMGASATRLSGPEPPIYPFLAKGDTAYFKWAYTVIGNSGQGINFTASLQNGYLGNVVTRNVTINAIPGSLPVKTIMGGGFTGATVSTAQNYLRFFGDHGPSTSYALKNMTVPISGTFKNLNVNKATGATSVTFTLYKNGGPTGLTCVTSNLAPAACSDLTHSVTVSAGDTIALGMQQNTITSTGDVSFSVEFDPS